MNYWNNFFIINIEIYIYIYHLFVDYYYYYYYYTITSTGAPSLRFDFLYNSSKFNGPDFNSY